MPPGHARRQCNPRHPKVASTFHLGVIAGFAESPARISPRFHSWILVLAHGYSVGMQACALLAKSPCATGTRKRQEAAKTKPLLAISAKAGMAMVFRDPLLGLRKTFRRQR
ncbi:hypothetical protein [Rhodanobacter sp. B04]|uniref:hypothetical protein n=1 Tax=Rhodanobacter sp. B04 TaxID=1945860 RepID=UPI0011155C0E|nr:hypothetical protein [Rhodanobacter sp. B04]